MNYSWMKSMGGKIGSLLMVVINSLIVNFQPKYFDCSVMNCMRRCLGFRGSGLLQFELKSEQVKKSGVWVFPGYCELWDIISEIFPTRGSIKNKK